MKHPLKNAARRKLTREHLSGSFGSHRMRRLLFEPLEDRRVLATFFVDGGVGSDANPGSALLPFATIQRGINEAASASGDDIVEVAPAFGGYTENLSIADTSGALTLRGSTGTATDVIVSGGGSDVITVLLINDVTLESLHAQVGGIGILVTGGAADLVVDNVRSSDHSAGGLVVRASGDLTVLDTEITAVNYGMFLENFGDLLVERTDSSVNRFDGIFANRGNSVTVRGSTLDGNLSEGIFASNIPRIDLEDTSLSNNRDNGADIRNSGDITMTDMTVNANFGNGVSGVFATVVNSLEISGGDYSNNNFDGMSVFNIASTVEVTDVTASNNRFRGIRVGGAMATSGAETVVVQGGEFSDHDLYGIDISNARQSVTVLDANAADNLRSGLIVGGSTNAPVTIIGGTYTGNQRHGVDLNDVGGATIRGIQAIGNGSNLVSDGTGGGGISISLFNTTTPDPILIEGATVSDNLSRNEGAGIYVFSFSTTPEVTIRDSTVTNNSNQFSQLPGGGGIAVTNALFTLEGTTVAANKTGAQGGGGVYLESSDSQIVNSTISGNEAPFGTGGGIYVRNGSLGLEMTNVTITENVAATGGGVYRASGVVTPLNTIIAANSANRTAPDYFGSVSSLGNNLVGNASGVFGTGFTAPGDQAGTSSSPIDPLLGPLQNNGGPTDTHELLLGSPAINAGNNTGAPAADQRGVSRPQGGTVDIGAYELILNLPPVAKAGGPYTVDEGGSVQLIGCIRHHRRSPGNSDL